MPQTEDLVTTAEAAVLTGKHVATINRWVKRGILLPAWEAPGKTGIRLYRRLDVEALAAQQVAS